MELKNNPQLIYSFLGQYISDTFFCVDQKGNEVFPLIDTYFIKSFCVLQEITYSEFISFVQRRNIWNVRRSSSNMEILGFVGFQLYAASMMENSDGHTSINFRDRICNRDMLNIELTEWQQWAVDNQDDIWKQYYSWCRNNGFVIVNECSPRYGKDRYVQYPKVHSELTLNREDLKGIAAIFVEKKLQPYEDISERDFWRVIGRNHYKGYYSSRSLSILTENRDLVNKQIFQFYQIWDGEYTDCIKNKKTQANLYQLCLFQTNNIWSIDVVRIKTSELIISIELNFNNLIQEIQRFYDYRRDDIILFKKSEEYDDYWIETRYLDSIEDEGIAIVFNRYWLKRYPEKDVIKHYSKFIILKLNYHSDCYREFYAQDKGFKLRGGMKIAPNTYLLGAPPLLELKRPTTFWVDGKERYSNDFIQRFNFEEGKHQIKIKDYRSIEVCITKPIHSFLAWGDNVKWRLSRKDEICWSSQTKDGDIYGLDFESYSQENKKLAPLPQWCRCKLFNPINKSQDTNIVLRIVK